ncbi:hypothetical protein IEQ34_006169 [Dendrobium chrysotoxum]|uniref:Uncharacterized protein n=1 Tax=Dendrobium chrysotoxum TaxID=161865 RepID=A0AAV7HAM2_DENCH|nr:hypothetical protein IEQ34_006169 [Dendrobium chrysotoxum]
MDKHPVIINEIGGSELEDPARANGDAYEGLDAMELGLEGPIASEALQRVGPGKPDGRLCSVSARRRWSSRLGSSKRPRQ